MIIEYGPPGISGVTDIQVLSGDEAPAAPVDINSLARKATALSLVVWLGASVTGYKKVAEISGWAAVLSAITQAATTPQ